MNGPSKTLLGIIILSVFGLQTACDTQTAAETPETNGSILVKVEGMVCVNCVRSLQHHFAALEEIHQVFVSLPHGEMLLELFPGQELTDQQLTEAVKEAGYEAKGILRSQTPFETEKERLRGSHER